MCFPGGSDGKESACNTGDLDLIPMLGRSSWGENGNPLKYSCLENSMDRGAWQATVQFSSVQSLSHVRLCDPMNCSTILPCLSSTPGACKFMSIESVMPSKHLILFRPLLFLPSIFPIIKVFSSEWVLHIRWPKYWRFSFSISPSNEFRTEFL